MENNKKDINEREIQNLIYEKQYQQKVGFAYAFMTSTTIYLFLFLVFLYMNNLDFLFIFNIATPTDVMLWTVVSTMITYRTLVNERRYKYQSLPIMQKLISFKKMSKRYV